MKTVSPYYLEGIKDARATFTKHGIEVARDQLQNIESTIRRGFDASNPVGQMLRGERDFWRNQLKRVQA